MTLLTEGKKNNNNKHYQCKLQKDDLDLTQGSNDKILPMQCALHEFYVAFQSGQLTEKTTTIHQYKLFSI